MKSDGLLDKAMAEMQPNKPKWTTDTDYRSTQNMCSGWYHQNWTGAKR